MRKEPWYVISIGGHLLHRGAKSVEDLDFTWYKEYARIIKSLHDKGYKFAVVCGGGDICREEIKKAREKGVTDKIKLDMIGVEWTHYNAKKLAEQLKSLSTFYGAPETDIEKIIEDVKKDKIPICGGEKPGHSTDYDTAFIAKSIKERGIETVFIDARRYPMYDKDPAIYKDAKKLDKVLSSKLLEMAKELKQDPGTYQIDLHAVEVVHKYKIKGILIDGYTNPEEIIRAVEGKHNGTVIE